MGKYDTVISTKISHEDYQFLQKIAQYIFAKGMTKDPPVSNIVRILIRGYLKRWRNANPFSVVSSYNQPQPSDIDALPPV
ncbi:MAG TPA: hypothetical protein VF884_06995 [Nitrososphaeraceae archaeon]